MALGLGIGIHFCEWDFGAGGDKLICISHRTSLVLQYLLPWASTM